MIFQFGWLFCFIHWLINVSNPPESRCGMWNTSSDVRFSYLLVSTVKLFMLSCFINRSCHNHRSHLMTFQISGSILMITKFLSWELLPFQGLILSNVNDLTRTTSSYFYFSAFATINDEMLFWQSNFLSLDIWDRNIKLSRISLSENHGKSFTRCRCSFSYEFLGLFNEYVTNFVPYPSHTWTLSHFIFHSI